MNEKIRTKPALSLTFCLELLLLLVLVLFMPTQAAYSIQKGRNVIYVAWGDIITALVFGVWCLIMLFARTFEGQPRWRSIKVAPWVFWVFIFAAVVSCLNSPSIYAALAETRGGWKALLGDARIRNPLAELAQYVLYFIIGYTLLRNLTSDHLRLRVVVTFLFVLATGILLIGLIQYTTVDDPVKVSGTFGSRNILGGFWAMLAPLILAVGLATKSIPTKVWAFALVAVTVLTLLSGGALLALVIVLPLTARRFCRPAMWVTIVSLAAGLIFVSLGKTRTYRQGIGPLLQTRDEEGDIKKQYIEWQADVNMLAEHLLTGVGLGNYQLNVGEYYTYLPNKEKMPLDCNNQYLVFASSLGITGLLAFIFILWYYIRCAQHVFVTSENAWERGVALGCWGGIWGFAITNVFHALFVRGTGMLFVLLLAIVGTLGERERQKQQAMQL